MLLTLYLGSSKWNFKLQAIKWTRYGSSNEWELVGYLRCLVQPVQEKGKIYKMGKEGTYIRSWPIASTN